LNIIASLIGTGVVSGLGWKAKDALSALRREHEKTLPDYLPWRRLVRPNVVTTSEDEYMTVFRFAARDVGTQSPAELFEVARRFAASIGSLKPRPAIKIQIHAIRQQTAEYLRPTVKPSNPVLDAADEERERFFREEDPGWETVRFLTLAWRPQDDDLTRLRAAAAKDIDAAIAIDQELLAQFERHVAGLKTSLDDVFETVERLGEYTEVDPFGVTCKRSRLLEFLHYFVVGRFLPFNVPTAWSPVELNGLLSSRGFDGQVPFPKIGGDFVLPIILKTFPSESQPQILDELAKVGVSHYFSTRFLPLDLAAAHGHLRDAILDFQSQSKENESFLDPGAAASAAEIADAYGAAKGMPFGWGTFTVVVRASTLPELMTAKNTLVLALQKAGFPNAYTPEEGGWNEIAATFPGAERWCGVHRHLEHALGIATLVPLHEHARGRTYSDHPYRVAQTPPLFCAMGSGQAATRVHLSVADVEHVLILCKSGWGKTTMDAYLALMRLARLPYSGISTYDKGLGSGSSCGSYRACLMADGVVYEPRTEGSGGFALFDRIEDQDYVDDVMRILTEIISLWEDAPDADEDKSLRRALYVMSASPPEFRSMTNFLGHLQNDTLRLRGILEKYTSAGPLGHLLDSTHDSFSTNHWSVFDLEHIYAMEDDRFIIPVLKTLFLKTARGAADKRKSLGDLGPYFQHQIVVDEAHLLLATEAGQRNVKSILKTGRGKNISITLSTNGLEEVARSVASTELLTQVPSRIFGADASANDGQKPEMLRDLGLNDRGFDWITHPENPRDFVLMQPDLGICQRLNARLNAPMLALIGDPRKNYIVDVFREKWPAEIWGLHRWKLELLDYEAEHAQSAADRASIAAFAARLRAKISALKAHETPGILIGA
jgi:type IV secretory pathway VirB4 component